MSVKEELTALIEKINANPVHIENEKDRVFQINLDEGQIFQLIIKDGGVSVEEGTSHEPQVTLKISESNFSQLLKDKLNTTMAFMMGNLKVDGNVGLAMKLQDILKKYQ